MEITGHNAVTVIDVNDIPRKKEIRDERNNTSIRRAHWRAKLSSEIHTEVSTR